MFFFLKLISRFKKKNISNVLRFSSKNYPVKSSNKFSSQWKIIFYGTDSISETTLKALNNNRLSCDSSKVVESLEVVCVESDCQVRKYATCNNLTIHTWPFDVPPNIYDVGIVVSFGHMIPSSSIHACKYGIINAHPSLLPRWRGAAPIFHTILNGDSETGVTITQVSPNKFDVGNILMQERYVINERCSAKTLTNDLSILAAEMVLKTLSKLPSYIEAGYPQPSEGRTLARKIKRERCTINWTEDTSLTIDRKFRAFDGFFDVSTTWKGSFKVDVLDIALPLEINEAKICNLVKDPVNPGYCFFHKRRKVIFVKCKDGWSGIKSLRIPKRGAISALDFYNGFMTKVDPKTWYFV